MWISVVLVTLAISLVAESVIQTQVTCEGKTMALQCANGLTIKSAVYGRKDKTTCSEGYSTTSGELQVTSCSSTSETLDIVNSACNGKRSCSVVVLNDLIGGDPCKGTYKYLTVTYDCPVDGAATAAVVPTNTPIAAAPTQTTATKAGAQNIVTTVPTSKPIATAPPQAQTTKASLQKIITTVSPKKTVKVVVTTAKTPSTIAANKLATTLSPKSTAKTVATTAKPTAARTLKTTPAKSNNGNHYGESSVKPTTKSSGPLANVATTKAKRS